MADDKKNLHKGYVHYIPAVEEKDDWDKDLTFVLIRTLDELRVHDVEHDFTAWDTETSGLDPDMDYLVGFSFSFDGETGYYVPVAHDDMALGTEAVEIFYSILKKTRKTQFLFNCRFDQRFLETALKHKGWTLEGMPYYDVQNAIWLADTNVVMPSLKASTRHFLGWKPKTFDETLGDAVTFQHVPAEDAYFYACTDALMTYQLALVSNKFYRENLPASRFDNNMLYPLMRLENTPQRLDTEYLKSLVPQVEAIIERTREEVYRLAGTQFNLNAPQQFGKILVERFGVDTGARTATGAMKADLKTIDAWMVKHSSAIGQDIKDFIKAYKEYKKTVKFKSSYLDKYIKAASEQDIYPVRFSYKTNSVPTGRLSCGTSAKNKFFTNNNVQCLEENTSVITSEGIKPIKHVNTGDLVWTGSSFVPCVQLGSKQKRCETVWTYFGKITASLEHKFYTLNLYTFELEWDELAYAIAQGKPIVRNVGDGGFTLRELLENEMFQKSMLLKPELSEERIKELEELYEDVRFDMIRKADNFWYPNIIPPEVTVYDLCVPTYERFTANGFIVHNSTPKPHAVMLKGRKATEQEIAESRDILGWYFSNEIPDEEAKGLVEGMDPDNLNIRRAFLPENDQCYVVSIDMAAEELRVVANLYHEDTWINAFNSGADVHKACYSPDTEFYVKSHGWMYAENITPEMEIAYYDVRSDSFKFTKADKRATQKGRDVYVRSGVFNVTGNHRMYVNFDTQGYHIERADNLKNCGNAKQRFHMKTAVGTRVEFSKERNKDNATAFALGFLSSIDKEFEGTRMSVKCSTLYPDILQILKDYACNSTNKTLFAFSDKGVSYLTSLGFSTSLGRVVDDAQILTSRNSYRGFICGLLHGLACRKDSEIYLGDGYDLHGRAYVKDKALADWIQWHLTCNGYSCMVKHNVISDRYALYIESRQDKDVCMTFHSVKGHSLTNGGIYSCFEVPSGLLVTRYDGRITVNGNTAIKLFGEENYTKDARKKAKCLSGDTMVHTVDGRSIQIRNLVSEETHMNAVEGNPVDIRYKEIKISTPDGWSDVTHWIYNGFRETLKIIIDRRLMLEVTPDHLVGKYEPDAHEDDSKKYTLVRADSLSEGDLVLWDYCPMRITSIQKGYSDVYDITVDNRSHTFHANGVVVHNCASFGILYGSGAQGFNNSFPDMTLDECREFMKKFKDALPAISQGQAENIAYARQHGDINTGFGRHRRVKFWLSSSDRAKQAFGERTVKNCYSPDTEYMTKDGWKVAADIEPTTQLAYYDPDTGVIRYCDAGIRYTHVCTESMKFSSRTADWDVTTNHRMWIRSTSHDRWRPCEAGSLENLTVWQEICSADLCSSLVETSDLTTPLGTFSRMHLARLFAWVLTDSTITEKEHYIVCTQNKPQNFSVIEETFSKFGAKVTVRNCVQASSGKEMKAYLAKPEFCEWVLGQIGGRLKQERRVPAWVFNSSKEVREEFLRHLVLADGTPSKHSKKQGCAFYSANKSLVDDVQILFTMTGFRASLQTYHNANGTEVYRLNCVKTSVRSMDNRIRKSGNKQLTRVKHEPIEYSCFSVPTQILVTRHHGKVTFGMNTAVQGTAADVLKIIFCRLWEKVFKPYPQVKFMSTIHDEVNFSIPIELAREVIPVCIECMTIEREDWPVPLKCSLSLSRTDLGSLIPFTYDAATDTYEPEWDTLEVKPKVTHNVETKIVDTEDKSLSDDCVCGVSLDEIDF